MNVKIIFYNFGKVCSVHTSYTSYYSSYGNTREIFRKYAKINPLHENKQELGRIKNNIATLMRDKDYIIDSLVITASCSPEGSYRSNEILSGQRANSIKNYFLNYDLRTHTVIVLQFLYKYKRYFSISQISPCCVP